MFVIGLTGSIGSGKSTVSSILRDLGAYIIDADMIAHEVVMPGTEGLELVCKEFGHKMLDESGMLDRRRLGDMVFSDAEKLKRLNELLHPLIFKRIDEELHKLKQSSPVAITVLDAPLLIECNLQNKVDEVWLVIADDDIRLDRLMERNGLSYQQALKRMSSQMPQEEKLKYADIVIENNGEKEQLKQRVVQLYSERTGYPLCD